MKVILSQDVKGLGKKGDMVEAKDGYARNYLLPRKMAIMANSSNVNVMNTQKKAEDHKKNMELQHAQDVANELKAKHLIMPVKTGGNGKLFGSIGSAEIAEKIKKDYNIEVDKRKIVMDGNIKRLGETEIEIKLYAGVAAKIVVELVEQE
jgi:large subunit ribosomal protein L9